MSDLLNETLREMSKGIPSDPWYPEKAPKNPWGGDFHVQNEGSIMILWPDSPVALQWCYNHLPEDCPRWGGNGFVIEHRYIADVVDGMIRDELEMRG